MERKSNQLRNYVVGTLVGLATLAGAYNLVSNVSIERFKDEKLWAVYSNPEAKEVSKGLELTLYGNKLYPLGVKSEFTGIPIATKTDVNGYPLEFSKNDTLSGTISINPEYGRILTTDNGSQYRVSRVHDSTFLEKLN